MKRLLYIAHRVPYPPDKGERVRAFHQIQALAEHFRVTLAALAHTPADAGAARELQRRCERVVTARAGGRTGLLRGAAALLRGKSVTEGYFRSRRLARALREEAAREPFDLAVAYSSSALPYALAVPAAARVADLVDADSAKWAAYARSARWPTSWLYRREARGVARLEQQALHACDAVVLVSEAEAQVLARQRSVSALRGGSPYPPRKKERSLGRAAGAETRRARDSLVAPGSGSERVIAVGNGVDTDYFRPQGRPADGPPTLVFTGTMDYRPNVEGMCWFAEAIWPALRRERPDLRFTIVGRNPAPAVRRLAERPGIEVTGSVPDVRPYLARAALVVAPLLMARGIQNKVLEAMAMGRAVVASPAALEGLEVQTPTEAVEAQPPEQWQREILDLLENDARRQAVEQAARACIESRFTWNRQMRPLVDLCLDLSGAPGHVHDTGNGDEAPHAPVPPRPQDVAAPRAGE